LVSFFQSLFGSSRTLKHFNQCKVSPKAETEKKIVKTLGVNSREKKNHPADTCKCRMWTYQGHLLFMGHQQQANTLLSKFIKFMLGKQTPLTV
jgi:hypothetical protein